LAKILSRLAHSTISRRVIEGEILSDCHPAVGDWNYIDRPRSPSDRFLEINIRHCG
jgi:hypothetical protein